MPSPPFHSSKPLSKTWLNRIFSIIYSLAVLTLLFRHCRNLIYSPTPISFTLFVADFVLAFLWVTAQCFHWNPIQRKVYLENLKQVISESEYPALDVVICTADPTKEPPVVVVNTALSMLAYDYPTDKLSVYISDDGGSNMTLYAFIECAKFAKHWIPYCKKHDIVDRAPEVYFASHPVWFPETDEIQCMYESMKSRIQNGEIYFDTKFREAFNKLTPNFTPQHHPTVVQILLDNVVDIDVEGGGMPNLIYVSREKAIDKPHNFKAGALNVMLRVSGLITDAPIVLVVDCDMYSNDPETPLRALCYFMDPHADPKLGFVQFPQKFNGISKNDIYASESKREMQILILGMDGLLGAHFMGTGGFLKRRAISGSSSIGVNTPKVQKNSKPIKCEDGLVLVEEAARCNYEDNTQWGSKIGFRYGSLTEDFNTSFRLHCEGWKSIFCNPKRPAFLGGSATSDLNEALTQIKRWYMGFLAIFFSKYCPLTYGIRSINPVLALCYTHYTLRSFWSIPIIIYGFLPQISLINSVPIFTKVSEDWFLLYAFLFLGAYGKDFIDFVVFGGGSIQRWWNSQRMWLMWGMSSHPFALFELSLKYLGLSTPGFNVTSKVVEEEQKTRYEQDVFEFGVESSFFFWISVASVLNLFSFVKGVTEVLIMNGKLEELFVQIFISGFVMVSSWPIYEAMVFRRDRGRMPLKITLASLLATVAICLVSSLFFNTLVLLEEP